MALANHQDADRVTDERVIEGEHGNSFIVSEIAFNVRYMPCHVHIRGIWTI